MGIAFNLKKLLLSVLADLEFHLTNFNGKRQFFREKYFDLMRVKYEKKFYIGHNLEVRNLGNLALGNRCCIGSYSRIWNYAAVVIGDDFLSAGCLTINSGTHDPVTLEPKGEEIKIGSRVWCGVNVTILAGVTIGNDVVIGAGSVVVNNISDGCIVAGVPARKIRDLNRSKIEIWRPFNWRDDLW
jgi:maltose O-acetyltransferase